MQEEHESWQERNAREQVEQRRRVTKEFSEVRTFARVMFGIEAFFAVLFASGVTAVCAAVLY